MKYKIFTTSLRGALATATWQSLLIIACYIFTPPHLCLAQHFVSPSYIINWGNFNITSGKKTSTNYFLTDTVGQNSPGQYNSTGYKVKSGFQYIYDTFNQFTFTISDLNINLGTIAAGVATTATNTISISTPSGHGYQIMAQQNHPLALRTGTTIPNTACDGATCTPTTSGVWTSTSTYGFGFNAIGSSGTSTYFTNNTYYRPFSTTGQIIMSETVPVKNHSALVSYKTVISSVQAAGSYQNAIIFTAVPRY